MISLLQSVRNIPAVLQAAHAALRPGGWLVFADRVFDARWDGYRAGGEQTPFWDVGHPNAPKQTLLDVFFAAFEEVHLERFTKESGTAGRPPHGQAPNREVEGMYSRANSGAPNLRDEQVYFIGRRL